jgi:hypothetical protein
VDDALNYVHGEREVVETLRGIRRSLAPDGVGGCPARRGTSWRRSCE